MSNVETVEQFRGKHRFLSNFWPCRIFYEGDQCSYVEQAWQMAKFPAGDIRKMMLRPSMTPTLCKRLARDLLEEQIKRSDEERIKLMQRLVLQKFDPDLNPILHKLLMGTGEKPLQEGNWWNDKFWGVCLKTGKGENNLGKVLMKVRKQLRSGK